VLEEQLDIIQYKLNILFVHFSYYYMRLSILVALRSTVCEIKNATTSSLFIGGCVNQ
jgi:hypothetical protein